jgi:hypothetical protein
MMTELLSAAEAARILGVTRGRVVELARSDPGFPPPQPSPAGGRVWPRVAVQAWAAAHPDRGPLHRGPSVPEVGGRSAAVWKVANLAGEEAQARNHTWIGARESSSTPTAHQSSRPTAWRCGSTTSTVTATRCSPTTGSQCTPSSMRTAKRSWPRTAGPWSSQSRSLRAQAWNHPPAALDRHSSLVTPRRPQPSTVTAGSSPAPTNGSVSLVTPPAGGKRPSASGPTGPG